MEFCMILKHDGTKTIITQCKWIVLLHEWSNCTWKRKTSFVYIVGIIFQVSDYQWSSLQTVPDLLWCSVVLRVGLSPPLRVLQCDTSVAWMGGEALSIILSSFLSILLSVTSNRTEPAVPKSLLSLLSWTLEMVWTFSRGTVCVNATVHESVCRLSPASPW